MQQKNGTATTRDGTRLAYTLHECGRSGAPRIALIHSIALDRSVWDGVVHALRGEADVLAYDCRGHGASSKTPGPYTMQLFAEDLRDLLDAIGWRSAVLAGVSMGGSIALQVAASFPERTHGLGLVATTAWYGTDARTQWRARADAAVKDGLASMVAAQEDRWFGDAFRAERPDLVRRFGDVFAANDVAVYVAACAMLGGFDLRPGLGAITVPTAVVVGEDDAATPVSMARALHDGIPGSALTIVPGLRHLPQIEAPDRLADILHRLL